MDLGTGNSGLQADELFPTWALGNFRLGSMFDKNQHLRLLSIARGLGNVWDVYGGLSNIDRRDVPAAGSVTKRGIDGVSDTILSIPMGDDGRPTYIVGDAASEVIPEMGSSTPIIIEGSGVQILDAGEAERYPTVLERQSVEILQEEIQKAETEEMSQDYGNWIVIEDLGNNVRLQSKANPDLKIIQPKIIPQAGIVETKEESKMAQDFGEFIIGTAQDLITQRLGLGQQNLIPPAVAAGGAAAAAAAADALGIGLPGVDVVSTGDKTKGKMYNPRTGKWVRCHRRRRKLLTDTDFACLAKLKTLTGNNDAFKVAVMKAVR